MLLKKIYLYIHCTLLYKVVREFKLTEPLPSKALVLFGVSFMTSRVKMFGPLIQKILLGQWLFWTLWTGIKTGTKYYVFNNGNENRVKNFRGKTQENMGKKPCFGMCLIILSQKIFYTPRCILFWIRPLTTIGLCLYQGFLRITSMIQANIF